MLYLYILKHIDKMANTIWYANIRVAVVASSDAEVCDMLTEVLTANSGFRTGSDDGILDWHYVGEELRVDTNKEWNPDTYEEDTFDNYGND